MVALAYDPELAMFPPEFIAAIKAQAASDADAVGAFLLASELHPAVRRSGKPIDISLEYLIGIGLGIRLRRWQQGHIARALGAPLPSVEKFLTLVGVLPRGVPLCEIVARAWIVLTRAFHASFLWWIDADDPRVELAIMPGDTEKLLDAIADYLWEQIQRSVGHEG